VSDGNDAGAQRAVRRALDEARHGVIPVVSDVHAGWKRFNDPAARLARRKRRVARSFTLWVVLTLLSVLFAVTGYFGLLGGAAGVDGALKGIVGLLIFGTIAVRSGTKLRGLYRTQLPSRGASPPLPPAGSAAREPIRRLRDCESSLTELLASLPADSVNSRETADDAATTLRSLAERVQAIERARDNSPRDEHATLDTDLAPLVAQLQDGVEAYAGLVAAAGRAVAASSPGADTESLTAATDRLAGSAEALRELRSRY